MKQIDLAYLPVIGRGEQINLICALHGIEVNYLLSSPMGEDFDKDTQAPFGIIPWMKDMSNGLELNDSMAIVQYLVAQYPGPLTPKNNETAARINMYWAWVQDYYSFVLSPFHDIITGHNETFWRNLRLTDSLADGAFERAKSRAVFNWRHLLLCRYLSLYLRTRRSRNRGFWYVKRGLWRRPICRIPNRSQHNRGSRRAQHRKRQRRQICAMSHLRRRL